MCQLIESISIKNGETQHIKWHEARMQRARQELFGLENEIKLLNHIQIPAWASTQWTKCRISYGRAIEKIEFEAYRLRQVQSLKLVEDDNIQYQHKYKKRTQLDKLFAARGDCDSILIVKNGFITDTYYANVVFENEVGYFTPDRPLLLGTQRERLLATQQIQARPIRIEDTASFKRVHLINAFMELGDCVVEL